MYAVPHVHTQALASIHAWWLCLEGEDGWSCTAGVHHVYQSVCAGYAPPTSGSGEGGARASCTYCSFMYTGACCSFMYMHGCVLLRACTGVYCSVHARVCTAPCMHGCVPYRDKGLEGGRVSKRPDEQIEERNGNLRHKGRERRHIGGGTRGRCQGGRRAREARQAAEAM